MPGPQLHRVADLAGARLDVAPLAIQTAPLWGRVPAGMVLGRPDLIDVSDLGPDRLYRAGTAPGPVVRPHR